MNNSLVSVVIPVFNVENYISECIESIISQTYKNTEIILVDDGSTDSSGSICYDYSLKDSRIKVYHKSNGGLSDARNYGIAKSNGEYVYLIDSDDFLIRNDTIEVLYKNILNNNADISMSRYIEYFVKSDRTLKENYKENYKEKTYVFSNKDIIDKSYDYLNYKANFIVAWNKLYKKSLFDNINYPVGKLHEDEFTTYKLYLEAQRIVFIDLETYAYRQREGSIMNSKYNLRKLDIIDAIEEKIVVLNSNGMDILETEYNYLNLLSFNMYMLKQNNYIDIYNILFQKFKNLYPLVKNKYNLKRKVKLFILRYFNYFYYKYIAKI